MPEHEKYRIQLRLIDPQGRAIEGWREVMVPIDLEAEAVLRDCLEYAKAAVSVLADLDEDAGELLEKVLDC